MPSLSSLIAMFGLGAGLMYFYDPLGGDRRRVQARDQWFSMRRKTADAFETAQLDLKQRTLGTMAGTLSRFSADQPFDRLIEERVRAELGRSTSYPRAIEVTSSGGQVTLSGPILKEEADYLVRRIARVRGVKDIDNQLQIHDLPGDVPGLQGNPNVWRARPEWAQENWSPGMRLVSGVGGGLLALYGVTRKGLSGSAISLAGLGLAARSVANLDLKTLLGMSERKDAVRLHKAVNIAAPVEDLYRFWANYENFPRFLAHVKEVKNLGNGRSHWKVAGPAGTAVEWDAVTTREIPNQELAWESVAGSQVQMEGVVQFHETPDGGTRVAVHLNYTPPAGALGHAVATLFGSNPRQEMNDDLARLKTLFEAGKTTVKGVKLSDRDLAGNIS